MSKYHILDKSTPPSRANPEWVPHTATLCGREFHLGSDFLAASPDKIHYLNEEIMCKICLRRNKGMKNGYRS